MGCLKKKKKKGNIAQDGTQISPFTPLASLGIAHKPLIGLDYSNSFFFLLLSLKSVTNGQCSSGKTSLYSIWPAPVARGNTGGIVFVSLVC